eukprot:TRINITY_DN1842_c0_g1_i3.p1 TRINITY_DN1842_c0_g1~~TRINITY_DN1842_c0_g1_i3.p1  ORF type:complete len:217 (-),score=20.66 TRINITY_DN1842_c0_g1_i3:100-750(-)
MAGLNSQQSFSGLDEVMSDLGKVEQALKNIGSSSPKKNPQNPVRNGASEGQRSPPAQLGMSATASPATDRAIREQALRFEADKKILEARLVREKQEVEQRLLREKRELEEAYARERQSASDRSRQDRRELEESLSRERLEVSRLTQLLSDLPPPLSSRSSSSAASSRPLWRFFDRCEWEHTCWDPKDSELCLHRVRPEEILVEARSDNDVQIVRQM